METPYAQQYALVQDAREALLTYCATLAPADLLAPVAAFHNRSIGDLLMHVAGTYDFWLGQVALGRPAAPLPDARTATWRALFSATDALVAEFGRHAAGHWLTPAAFAVPGRATPLHSTPLQLFTHVITHEFHHKGQVLSMSRLLGYTPVDTDVIRFLSGTAAPKAE
ncbi:DinB family protein [Hymenobacter coalescens]